MNSASLHEMVSADGLSPAQSSEVLRILEGYLEELEHGGRPDPDELAARHPELADLLRQAVDLPPRLLDLVGVDLLLGFVHGQPR